MSSKHYLTGLLASAILWYGTSYGQDPVAVSPEIYTVLFENDDVRVIDIAIRPGERDEPHSHTNYMIYVRESGTLLVHPEGEEAYESTLERGQVRLLDPVEQHWAENVGDTVIRLVTIEFKE